MGRLWQPHNRTTYTAVLTLMSNNIFNFTLVNSLLCSQLSDTHKYVVYQSTKLFVCLFVCLFCWVICCHDIPGPEFVTSDLAIQLKTTLLWPIFFNWLPTVTCLFSPEDFTDEINVDIKKKVPFTYACLLCHITGMVANTSCYTYSWS